MIPGRLAILAACIAGAVVVTAGGRYAVLVQFLLDRIAYGTSNAATLFLLGVVAALAIGLPVRTISRWRNVALVALGTGFGVHAMLALRWLRTNRMPMDAMAVAWRDGGNSFMSWQHSHVGKVGLAALSSFVGGVGARYDTGAVFLADVPGVVAAGLGACLVVAVFAIVAWYSALFRPSGCGWRWPHRALFAIAAIVALKTQLDGGIAAHGALASCVVLAGFAAVGDAAAFERFWRRRGALALGGATLLSVLWSWTCSSGEVPVLGADLFHAALYAGLVLLAPVHARPWIPGALALYLGLNLWVDAESRLQPMLAPLPPGAQAWIVSSDGARIADNPDTSGRSAWAVFEGAGEDPRKPHRTLLSLPGNDGVRRVELVVHPRAMAAAGTLSEPADGAWRLTGADSDATALRLRLALADDRLPPFVGVSGGAITHHNLQVYLHWVAARLRAAGMTDFVIVLRRQQMASDPVPSSAVTPP